MTSFYEAARDGVRAAICQVGNVAGRTAGWLEPILTGGTDAQDAAQSFQTWACDLPEDEQLPPIPPPFTGGQCVGVTYTISYTTQTTRISDGFQLNETGTTNRVGPITGGTSPLVNGRWTVFISGLSTGQSVGSGIFGPYTINYTSVVRVDGLPDTCGNPPIPIPIFPPTGLPITRPIDYTDPDGDPQTEPGDWIITIPVINVNGELVVNFTFAPEFGPFNFDGSINLSTGDFVFSPSIFRPGRPTGAIGPPPSLPEPPSSDEPADNDPETALIRAVIVVMDVSDNNRASSLLYQGQPETYVPRLGVVRFAIAVPGGGASVWSADIPLKQSRQWIDCPSAFGATDVQAAPDPGSGNIVISITAVRGPSPFLNPD